MTSSGAVTCEHSPIYVYSLDEKAASGAAYTLRVEVDQTGTTTFPQSPGSGPLVFLRSTGSAPGAWEAIYNHGSGKVTVAGDGNSGTLDVELEPQSGDGQPVHLTGSWTCP